MREIDLGPVDPPERQAIDQPAAAGADLLSFGREQDTRDGDRPDWVARWWGYLHLPERWRRPVPRSLVAAVSAVVAGAVVAFYLDRPADEPPAPRGEPVPLLAPESWLDVSENYSGPLFFDEVDASGPRWEQALALHPPEAVVVLPLALYQSRLLGLPPGDYLVQASCTVQEVPESISQPVRYAVSVRDPGDFNDSPRGLPCDGELQILDVYLTVIGYQAYFSEFYFLFDEISEGEPDPYLALQRSDPVVVVSFTPA